MKWTEAVMQGLIFRSGVAVPGRAYCSMTCGTVWWNGQEVYCPPMAYGGVYIPTLCPAEIVRGGVMDAAGIDALPPQSQLPGNFSPQVIWRGSIKTTNPAHFIAALGYGPADYDGVWTNNILRMIWEVSQCGLRLNVRGWLEWCSARARCERGDQRVLYHPGW